ncbi:MAG: efflux RND transporter permease subunit, partial [Gammaproteobacteria bacterium]
PGQPVGRKGKANDVRHVLIFEQLPIDAFPDVSPAQVKVIIKAPGMTPQEVEQRITTPIELALLGIPRQTVLRSVTKYALTDITLDFREGTDIYWARQQTNERLQGVLAELPQNIEGGMAPATTPLGEMLMFTIDGDTLSLTEKRRLLDWVIRPALRTVPGVADVNALGGLVRTFEIVPDPARLAALGYTIDDVARAVEANNRNDGAGRLREGEETVLLRAVGRIEDLDDVRDTALGRRGETTIRVRDVATVRIGSLTRYGAVSADGVGEAVQGLVLGLRGANAQALVRDVHERLDALAAGLPEGISIDVFYDRGDLVARAVATVTRALGEAVVLVLITLVLLLGNLRAALAVAVVLPLAALATFLLMNVVGMSANLMSLGGLAIAIGILVDGAVVVVENIVNTLADPVRARHHSRLHLVYRATRQVAVPVASGIVIIMTVFLPLLTLEGIEGLLFSPVALTIVFALGASLLLSMSLVPVVASALLARTAHAEPWIPRQLARAYRPALDAALKHPALIVGGALAGLLAAAAVYPAIGKTFMPVLDEGDIIVQTEKIPSVTLAQSVDLDLRIQRAILAGVPGVERIVTRVGSDEIGMDPMGLNESDAFVVLSADGPPKTAVLAGLREVLARIPGLAYGFTQPIQMRTAEMLTGVRGDVAVKIFGSDFGELNRLAGEIAAVLDGIPGAADVFTPQNEGAQYVVAALDRDAAGRFGVAADDVAAALRALGEGRRLGVVQEGVQRTPLVVRGETPYVTALDDYLFIGSEGRRVPLGELASLERTAGLVSISRERGSRFAVVRSNVEDRDLVGFVDEARAAVEQAVRLPPGYRLEWGGEFENQRRAAARLGIVIPVAIGLVFLLLFVTFRSVRQSLLVLLNIPLALIGGVFALYFSGHYLSVPASVGFIALLGIAVLNGVVMVSYFNELRAEGRPLDEVVRVGAERRLRPVLLTATIAALGLLPLLFAQGPGSEIQKPLAIVVVGGLVSATALTLVVLPVLYRAFGERRPT